MYLCIIKTETMKTFIKDLIYPKVAFERKRTEYLSKFKKEYEDRTIAESILVEALYKIEFLHSTSERFLGAMEAVLVIENRIDPTKKLSEVKINKKETYKSLIIRLSKEYLKDKNVM